MSHIEPELLSAYLDQELTSAELAEVDGHLASCSSCADQLASMKFATTAVRTLEDPVMPELHRKQLFKEINRARRAPANKWRALIAVGGTAASVAAFAGLMMIGGGAGPNVAAGDAALQKDGSTWTQEDLDDLIASPEIMVSEDALSAPSVAAGPAGPTDTERVLPVDASGAEVNHGARIAQCETTIKPGGEDGAVALRYIVADYDGTPAYILVYEVPRDKPKTKQLFVVSRADCSILEMMESR